MHPIKLEMVYCRFKNSIYLAKHQFATTYIVAQRLEHANLNLGCRISDFSINDE